jgi:hypothetical protein
MARETPVGSPIAKFAPIDCPSAAFVAVARSALLNPDVCERRKSGTTIKKSAPISSNGAKRLNCGGTSRP